MDIAQMKRTKTLLRHFSAKVAQLLIFPIKNKVDSNKFNYKTKIIEVEGDQQRVSKTSSPKFILP